MRRSISLAALVAVLVPVALFAAVNRSGGKFWFFKNSGVSNASLQYPSLTDGSQLFMASPGDPTRQIFLFTQQGELVVGGAMDNSGRVVEPEKCVVLENNAQGTDRVILWSCSGNAQWNEKWELLSTGQVKAVNHGGCLDVDNGKAVIRACSNSATQKWPKLRAGGATMR